MASQAQLPTGVRELCGREDARGWVCILAPFHHTGHDYQDLMKTPILHPDATAVERWAWQAMESATHASQTAAIAKNQAMRSAADLRHALAAARIAMWGGVSTAVIGAALIVWPFVRTLFDL